MPIGALVFKIWQLAMPQISCMIFFFFIIIIIILSFFMRDHHASWDVTGLATYKLTCMVIIHQGVHVPLGLYPEKTFNPLGS